ncbi:MAG: LolA family protein [Planctomycetota bacterium]|jgi:outer membrane lipoprotein-sorting protein
MRPSEKIEKLIKKLHYKTSTETHDKVYGNVMQALDKHERQKSGPIKPDIWRTIMNNRTRKLAIVAAILIASLIGLHYITGPFGVTSTVYAEVAQRLQNARTLLYTVTTHTGIEWMPEMKMEIAFKEPGHMRMTMPGRYVLVMDRLQRKGLSIIPEQKRFIEIELSNVPGDGDRRQFETIEKLRSLPERADEVLGERKIDGRTVQGYRITEKGVTYTVWVDPGIRELVEIEMQFDNAPGVSGTATDFRFDVELDDSLFSLTPPDGYTRMEIQVDASEPDEEDFIEFLRLWSAKMKDSTFPPTVNPVELANSIKKMAKSGMLRSDNKTSDQEQQEVAMKTTYGMMFAMRLPAESNWRYAGENVKYGQADTPIFWYQPTGSQMYRIIYGDLSIEDIAQENLPK